MFQKEEFSLIEVGYWINKSKHMFSRNHIINKSNIDTFLKNRNNTGIFKTAYLYNNQNINSSLLYGDLYFDFDSEDDFNKAREDALKTISYLKIAYFLDVECIHIFFSGNKGIHLTVPAEIIGIEPNKELNCIYKLIASKIKNTTKHNTLDLVIYDNKRMFRIINSIHEVTHLYKIPLTYNELKNLSHDDIKALAENKRDIQFKEPIYNIAAHRKYEGLLDEYNIISNSHTNIKYHGTLTCTPPCIQHILEHGAEKGSRNNTVAVLSSFYRNSGLDQDSAIEKINEWNDSNAEPITSIEINRTIKSIYYGNASYGCNTIKLLSQCDESNCPLKKGQVNQYAATR